MSDKSVPDKPDKLDKFLEGKDITLNCLISDEEAIFDVTVFNGSNNRVSTLANVIRNRRLDRYQNTDLSKLILYMNKAEADRTPDISKTTHKCDLEQIDPFLEGQKIGFLRFSRHPEV